MSWIAEGKIDQVGTFNGNPLTMAAMRTTLTEILTPDAYAHLEALRLRAVAGLQRAIDDNELPAHIVSVGAKGCVVSATEPVHDFAGSSNR